MSLALAKMKPGALPVYPVYQTEDWKRTPWHKTPCLISNKPNERFAESDLTQIKRNASYFVMRRLTLLSFLPAWVLFSHLCARCPPVPISVFVLFTNELDFRRRRLGRTTPPAFPHIDERLFFLCSDWPGKTSLSPSHSHLDRRKETLAAIKSPPYSRPGLLLIRSSIWICSFSLVAKVSPTVFMPC